MSTISMFDCGLSSTVSVGISRGLEYHSRALLKVCLTSIINRQQGLRIFLPLSQDVIWQRNRNPGKIKKLKFPSRSVNS